MSDSSPNSPRRRMITRRGFLISMGGVAASLAVGVPLLLPEARLRAHQALLDGDQPPPIPPSPFVWFEIGADNRAKLFIPKVEMGQGIHTALAQIAADELYLDWTLVEVHQADLVRGFDPEAMFTFGSTSVVTMYRPLREAAATMREMLRAEAATRFGRPLDDDIVARASACTVRDAADQTLTYGALVSGKQGTWALPANPPALKSASAFTLIGQPVPRVDFHEKLTGRAIYGYDVRVPGMLYGAVARPPRYGATLRRAAPGQAAQMPGVVQVVVQDGFAGVVAERRSQARAAVQSLDLIWEGGTTVSQTELEQLVTVPPSGGVTIQRAGDVDTQMTSGRLIEAEYRTPPAAHATLEPQAALADVQPQRITIYTSTQSPGIVRDFVARALERDASQINVIPTYLGAGFGRKGGQDVGVEAARLSAAVGRPVHMGWTMTDELRHGFLRPPTHHRLRASLDARGNVTSIENQLSSGDVAFHFPELLPGGEALMAFLGADTLTALGSRIHYNIPHHRVIVHRPQLPIPTSFWRGLGLFPNTFALESFIDELAHAAGTDPLAFRLRHLADDALGRRYRAVLEAVGERSGWNTPAPDGRARGIACCYETGTVVAEVAEVSVENNAIRVHTVLCAADPGLVINPDGATAQAQGSIIMGLSSTLREEITVQDGMVVAENFDTYPLLTIRETPTIDVVFVPSSDEPVGGMGEPAIGPINAAVANAVFALTGERLRRLPLRLT